MSATEYKMIGVDGSDVEGMTARVTAAMADGWQPVGAPFFADGRLYQNVIKGTPIGSGDADYTLPAATDSAIGGVLQGDAVIDAVDDTDIVDQFNALLASLRAAGTIAE